MRKLQAVRKFLTGSEEGASIVEYALLLGLLAVVCLLWIATLGDTLSTLFTKLAARLASLG